MNKRFIFFVLFFTFYGYSFAQNINNEQRIIGTWVDNRETTWTFGRNGILSIDRTAFNRFVVIINTKLIIIHSTMGLIIYDFSISPDGRTLFLEHSSQSDIALSSPLINSFLLTRK